MRKYDSITIQRVLELRQVPGFGNADLAELATLAENVVERTFTTCTTVAAPASRIAAIHLVLEGRLETAASRHAWGPHRLFGALEAIAGRTVAERVVAAPGTRTLQIATAALAELLGDNHSVLSSARRTLARRLLAPGTTPLARRRAPVTESGGPLEMVDRLLLLRAQSWFQGAPIQALASLALTTEELYVPARAPIHRAGEAADGIQILLHGVAQAVGPHGLALLEPGAALGALESLAERTYTTDVGAITPMRVLHVPGAALLDAMEDRSDFGLALLGRLAGELLDLAQQPLPPEVN